MEAAARYDLRRTFGSLARSAGADLRYIQKAMGHESVTTTARIYAHLYDTELDQVSDALDRPTASTLTTEHGQEVASRRGRGTNTGAVRSPGMGDAQDEAEGNEAADLRQRQASAQHHTD